MTINRTAVGVVLPAILAMLVALLLMSRTASAQDTNAPPAPQATKSSPSVPPKTVVKPQARKEARDEAEEVHRPFQSSSSLKVIRYGRASRAYY